MKRPLRNMTIGEISKLLEADGPSKFEMHLTKEYKMGRGYVETLKICIWDSRHMHGHYPTLDEPWPDRQEILEKVRTQVESRRRSLEAAQERLKELEEEAGHGGARAKSG